MQISECFLWRFPFLCLISGSLALSTELIGDSHIFHKLVSAAESHLKVYIYERPENVTFRIYDGCPLHFRAETVIVQYFRESALRTYDPETADFFLVEHNFACIFWSSSIESYRQNRTVEEYRLHVLWYEHIKPIIRHIKKSPYLQRRFGHDHLVVFTYDTNPYCLYIKETMPFFLQLRNATFLLNFGVSPEAVSHTRLNCLRPNGADIILPQYHTFPLPRSPLSATFTRPYDTFFKGSYSNCGPYDEKCIRPFLEGLSESELSYHREMRFHSVPGAWNAVGVECAYFSICPAGYAPWSVRLYDSLFHDSIPVVLSNGIVFPFERFLNWSSFIIKVDTNKVYWDITNNTRTQEDGTISRGNMTLLRLLHESANEYRDWVNNSQARWPLSPVPSIWRKLHSARESLGWFVWAVNGTNNLLSGTNASVRSAPQRDHRYSASGGSKSVWKLILVELRCRTERGANASALAASLLSDRHHAKRTSDYCANPASVAALADYA
jgi:hypothetical protein